MPIIYRRETILAHKWRRKWPHCHLKLRISLPDPFPPFFPVGTGTQIIFSICAEILRDIYPYFSLTASLLIQSNSVIHSSSIWKYRASMAL